MFMDREVCMQRSRGFSLKQKILFTCFLVLISGLFIEGVAWILYFVFTRHSFPRREYQVAISNTRNIAAKQLPGEPENDVVHPYLGFVQNPHIANDLKPISQYGFLDEQDPILAKSADKLIIGIFGGSFAQEAFLEAKKSLIEALQPLHKEIIVLNLAMGGYKQPQQLLCLTYLQSLGAEFDIVINIDGFNEVALPPVENIPQKVFPVYPRNWYFKVSTLYDPELVSKTNKIRALYSQKERWAQFFTKYHLYNSITLCIIWRARDKSLEHQLRSILSELRAWKITGNVGYLVSGPPFSFTSNEELYDYLAVYWKRCSMQIQKICNAQHIRYYHFLQPNQYIENSKPMGEDELRIAIRADHAYKPGAVGGYPYLRRYGQELIAEGVNFHDLTMIFSQVPEIVYADSCCHLNLHGYEIIMRTIGETIAQDILSQNVTSVMTTGQD
jgi:hypothetical protein